MAHIVELVERVRERISPPTGPRVLLVPAFPGTRMGRRHFPFDDVVWFDLESIHRGRLLELAYEAAHPPLEPLGLFDEAYLQIKLRLQLAGYDVGEHPYDWRRPLRDLGEELAARVRAEGRPVHLVTHSYGGLVARAAGVAGAENLGKVIMLGPPNHGSFSVVQALRGSHWLLWLLSAVDDQHTVTQLAEEAFSTWPSVYPLLPTGASAADTDLYQLGGWPPAGPRPREDLLRAGLEARNWLGEPRGDLHVIAGSGVPTVQSLELRDGIFHYHRSDDGDGWVSTSQARLDGFPCYYLPCAHIGMPNHADVIAAVEDLLAHGTTERLARVPPPPALLAPKSDDDVPELPFGDRRGRRLEASDLRSALDELAGFVMAMPVT